MESSLTLIGYGEAGRTFATAADWAADARVFDIRPLHSLYAQDGVTGCETLGEALVGSRCVLSLVTADQSLAVAQAVTPLIERDTFFFDMNSVAPQTKQAAHALIAKHGAHYVDVAVMAPVQPARLDVPLLVSGPAAEQACGALKSLGFQRVRAVGEEIGRASTIKMLRSVMYKGMEALTAECLAACERAGVVDEVLGSFDKTWRDAADYRLDRMLVHGERRAAEMRESTRTLEALGIDPLMTLGTVAHQDRIGKLGQGSAPDDFLAKLKVISQ